MNENVDDVPAVDQDDAPAVDQDDAPAVDQGDVLADSDLLALIATNLDDIKMVLVTLLTFYIIFNVVRWSK